MCCIMHKFNKEEWKKYIDDDPGCTTFKEEGAPKAIICDGWVEKDDDD